MFERGVLCLTFDNMGNAVEVGRGNSAGPQESEIAELTIGYPNVLGLLDDLALKATFFLEGWNALHHPDAVRELQLRGHEIGLHGWVHEVFHSLSACEAERVLTDAQAAFRLLGIDPRGFRAPGGERGTHTAAILKKLGLQYDCSIDQDALATSPRLLDGDLPTIPWQWPMIDYYQYHMHPEGGRTPAQLEALWMQRLEEVARDRTLVTFIFHPFVSGVEPDRFAVMQRLLRRAALDPKIDVLSAGEVASRVHRYLQ